jgi:hypothetical protein
LAGKKGQTLGAAPVTINDDSIECPLCLGQGHLRRSEVLERLGMKDFARVAQLSAEEAFRLLLAKNKEQENALWLRFETETAKRLNEISAKHRNEIQALESQKAGLELRLAELEKNQNVLVRSIREAERLAAEGLLRGEISSLEGRIQELQAEKRYFEQEKIVELERLKSQLEPQIAAERSKSTDLSRKVNDHFGEISDLRSKNAALEAELAKVARIGKREEINFAEEAQSWPGIWLSDKLKKHGDYLLAFRDPGGAASDPRMLIDNKDKNLVTEDDVKKLIRDAKQHQIHVAALVTRDENQLRTSDREQRWSCKDGIWVLRTSRPWLRRDLEILKPLFERLRVEGPDFLAKNSVLAAEVRRSLLDIDAMEHELRKAANAIENTRGLATAYKGRLQALCDSAVRLDITSQTAIAAD